ncbi:MAG: RNA polymerase sigma factor [Deltaproteobacteria bacterium]|nr:RNA polymerase sigma factor [Deltaproteobacteria bacterium]
MNDVNSSAKSAADSSLSPAFSALFEEHFAYVCRSLRRLGVHEVDVKDVSQELFMTVMLRFGEYDSSRSARAWLFSFAVRFASNYRRLARHRLERLDVPDPMPSNPTDLLEARDLVLRGLARLEFDRRVVLIMHDIDGFPAPEIAAELGIPLNTVYSRLRLARADFRGAVGVRDP